MAKQVDDRARSSRIVGAAITENGAAIGAALGGALAPFLRAGEKMPDFAFFAQLIGRLLDGRTAKLLAANSALEQEATDDAEPRARRDACDSDLRMRLSFIRNQVQGIYGDLGLRAYAMWSPLPSGPDALLNYAVEVEKAFRTGKVTPAPVVPTRTVELRAVETAAELAPLVLALDTALKHVARERSELTTQQLAKNEAMTENDRDFVHFVSLFEQAARAAGRPEVADRIRPSGRDPGVLADPGDPADDPAVTPAPAAGASTDPATPRIEPGMPGSSPFRD